MHNVKELEERAYRGALPKFEPRSLAVNQTC